MSPSRAPAVWRRAMTVLTGCMLAAGLAGCAGAAPELESTASHSFSSASSKSPSPRQVATPPPH
jgi:ABC-type uncharacterized transport system auxiliary subunit